MAFITEELPASIGKLCLETGVANIIYTNIVKEDGVSILAKTEEKEMTLVGLDSSLAAIAAAIVR